MENNLKFERGKYGAVKEGFREGEAVEEGFREVEGGEEED